MSFIQVHTSVVHFVEKCGATCVGSRMRTQIKAGSCISFIGPISLQHFNPLCNEQYKNIVHYTALQPLVPPHTTSSLNLS